MIVCLIVYLSVCMQYPLGVSILHRFYSDIIIFLTNLVVYESIEYWMWLWLSSSSKCNSKVKVKFIVFLCSKTLSFFQSKLESCVVRIEPEGKEGEGVFMFGLVLERLSLWASSFHHSFQHVQICLVEWSVCLYVTLFCELTTLQNYLFIACGKFGRQAFRCISRRLGTLYNDFTVTKVTNLGFNMVTDLR